MSANFNLFDSKHFDSIDHLAKQTIYTAKDAEDDQEEVLPILLLDHNVVVLRTQEYTDLLERIERLDTALRASRAARKIEKAELKKLRALDSRPKSKK